MTYKINRKYFSLSIVYIVKRITFDTTKQKNIYPMKTRKEEIQNELKNLTSELNDPDNIMDSEWREFLENKRKELWAELRTLPVSKTVNH